MESNGRTTVHIFRNEMGQHVGTSLAQIVAEELGLSWEGCHNRLSSNGLHNHKHLWSAINGW